jgi:hypothetical protein
VQGNQSDLARNATRILETTISVDGITPRNSGGNDLYVWLADHATDCSTGAAWCGRSVEHVVGHIGELAPAGVIGEFGTTYSVPLASMAMGSAHTNLLS